MMMCQKLRASFIVLNINFIKSIFVLLFAIVLSSCTDSSVATNESTAVNNGQLVEQVAMFPAEYFDAGYKENYVVTGSDDFGRNYTGSYKILTGVKAIFNGVEVIPVDSILSYTANISGVETTPVTITLTQYYSAAVPRQYIGSVNRNTSLVLSLQDEATDIPILAVSDSSGEAARLVASDSSIEKIDWSVSSNTDGTYDMTYSYNDTDSAGGLIANEVHTFVVNPDGQRLSWEMISDIPSLTNTVRFSGNRQ